MAQTPDGKEIVVTWPTEGERFIAFSPNWCDRTTWYYSSIYVEDEVASPTADPKVFQLAHPNVIDTSHGKLTGEDFLRDSEGRSYLVEVKVNGVVLTERPPFEDVGGDYVVDYAAGSISFDVAPVSTPLVTYHYENGSAWVITPPAGKIILLRQAEVQFSDPIVITDTIVYQAYGVADAWVPDLVSAGAIPSGTRVPLGDPTVYKTLQDFINEANGAYPVIPPNGGAKRGTPVATHTFPWLYANAQAAIGIDYARGMEVEVKLKNDRAFEGFAATATFYGVLSNA